MPRALRSILLAALGIGVCTPLYADYQTTTPFYPGYKAALSRCDSLPDTEQARCIVNIRPTEPVGTRPPAVANSEPNTVKSGANRDDEYAEAFKECQAVTDVAERQRCIENAKDHLGRM
jgi:hypothetical protein